MINYHNLQWFVEKGFFGKRNFISFEKQTMIWHKYPFIFGEKQTNATLIEKMCKLRSLDVYHREEKRNEKYKKLKNEYQI